MTAESGNDQKDFHIVAIGASAGGLEPLERLFTHLPADTGMAFVVLQHLSPDFKSLMGELLTRRTSMPVRLAEQDMAVEAGSVYLLPPMKEMTITGRRLQLSGKDPRHGLSLPIDLFFRSLAHDVGNRAVAVILSGSGSDGSRGIMDVSRAGGVVFSESPDTAQFSGMPLSAMNTGVVDQVLAPEAIAQAIAALGRPVDGTQTDTAESPDAVAEDGSHAILRLLRDEYGIDFSHYKASTVTRRIERRLALNRSLDLDMYVEQLRTDPRELNSLYEDLLIGVTRFFRDDAFAALEHQIIPELVDRTPTGEQIRVWVPGCATGQEAYSLAMLLHERLASERKALNLKILATDVHKTSLEVASAGVYTEAQLAGVTRERLNRFFTLKSNGYQIAQALRESIVFAPHNVIRDAPFTKLDLITCRNLLIYFQQHAQRTVLTLFHFCLKPGGFLFLGSSETPGTLLDEFDTIDEHSKIYRKRRDIALPHDLKMPLPRSPVQPRPTPGFVRTTGVQPQLLALYDRLLDKFMPPSFLVDEQGYLVDSFGGVASLLAVRQRRPSQHLLEMLTDDLKTVVSGALHRVQREGESARYANVAIAAQEAPLTVEADPIRNPQGVVTHVLITLASERPDREAASDTAGPSSPPSSLVVPEQPLDVRTLSRDQKHALEDELSYTKQSLQAAIEELEATNEELQATNEELIASNEELQSTNEELHSVNEELYTVNAEYQKKNTELQELNNDIEHLLNGTDVATLFLDRQLCIRKFTPRIAEMFHVLPQDIGRPIRNFTHDLQHPTLLADVQRVVTGGDPVEAPTLDSHGRDYFLRILPYRSRNADGKEGAPDGVVVTLTDISALEQARARVAQLSAIVESSDDAIVGSSLNGRITTWNIGACRLYGYSVDEAVGRHLRILQPTGREDVLETVLAKVREGTPVEREEIALRRHDGTLVDVSVKFSPIYDGGETIVGVSAISRDVTQLIRARQEVSDREEQIRLLLDSTAEAIYGIDLNGVCTFCNPACARLLGYGSPADLIGKQLHPLIHHTKVDGTPYPAEQSPIFDATRHRREAHVDNEVLWRADGTSFPAEYWSHPIARGNEVIGAVVTFLDITDRREAEQELREGVKRREQFLAMLSHELRNPLAAILSATRLIEGAVVVDAVRQEAGLVVERQARHMARLLDDLLDVARITRGRIVLRNERLDLRDTTRSAIEALGPFLAEHESHLELDIPDEPIPVVGDPARLQQIQANLLSNASKYSPRGGHIRLALNRVDGHAMIRVSDDGHGIDPRVLPRIFDLFVQGDRSLARSEGGLGIGLTLLRSLVELHNGRVEAHSFGQGHGTTFTVWLPLASAALAAGAMRDGATEPDTVRTVVLVEDQADARRMLQLLLEAHGVNVFTADNGKAGAELIERVRPELALVDLGLPVMSGFELARHIRRSIDHATTRLVALSGYGQDSDVQAALEAGFDEHVTKPPDPERLERLLAGGERRGRARNAPSPS